MDDARIIRVYADTSVFGGCFDDEFREASRGFFSCIKEGTFRLVVSETILLELQDAPDNVREVLAGLAPDVLEEVPVTDAVEELRDAYIAAGVLTDGSVLDAEHVACATVADVDFVVSWNYKHLVHYERISGFQGVNLIHGYTAIRIFSPLEVI